MSSDTRRRVLVTGASGFIGAALVDRLLDAGWDVQALAKRPLSRPVSTLIGQLPDLDDIPRVDAVVHLGSPPSNGSREIFQQGIVRATEAIIRLAEQRGVRRFVYASSVKAVGEESAADIWGEHTPRQPTSDYGEAKARAESIVFSAAGSIEPVVLRFPLVYGPGMTTRNMLRLFGLVARGIPIPLGGIRNRRHMLYLDHAVDAIMVALTHERAIGRSWFVADEPAISTPALLREIGAALDRPVRLLSVPDSVWRTLGRIGDKLPPGVPAIRSEEVARLFGNLVVDAEPIRRELGFESTVPLTEALRRTAQALGAGDRP